MGRPAKWQSTRKRVAFAPTTMTTTTIEPDGAPVLLPESARAGERRRLKPSPLVARARQQPKYRVALDLFGLRRRMLRRALWPPLISRLPQPIRRRFSSLRFAKGEMR